MRPHFPTRSVAIFRYSGEMEQERCAQSASWYFSKEGEAAYRAAKTPIQRVEYLYRYLTSLKTDLAQSDMKRDEAMKLSMLLAYTVWESSLPFAKYPDLLKPETNRLVDLYVHQCVVRTTEPWLSALYGERVTNARVLQTDPKTEPALYRASRMTQWLFCNEQTGLPSPYVPQNVLRGVDASCMNGADVEEEDEYDEYDE